MKAEHFEILVEEPSMEAFLRELLPRLLDGRATFEVHPHQGKSDLLAKLYGRLKAYAQWLPETARIIVVVDRDSDDCTMLKQRMEQAALDTGLLTRSRAGTAPWQVLNRMAVEELEAWYFGDWPGLRRSYPRAPATVPAQAKYKQPDAIAGGTWEALERILQRAGYFASGLNKMELAAALGRTIDPAANRSPSFQIFRAALLEAVT